MEKQPIRVLLVDDEALVREDLRARLAAYPDIQVVGDAGCYQAAMELLQRADVDLVFTDIQMADGSGFQLSRAIQKRRPELPIIFLTGHAGLALEGYEYRPLDFLVKPVRRERLEQALAYARERLQAAPAAEVSVALRTESGLRLFRPSEIAYVEKTLHKVRILCRDGREFSSAVSLQEVADALETHGFYRCHQSYLISLREIAGIRRDPFGRSYLISLRSCESEIPLSRRKYHELLALLNE